MIKNILYKIKSNRARELVIKFYKKKENGEAWSNTIRILYKKWYNIDIGIGSYGGCFKPQKIANGTVIGKYCSFANDVYIYNANHPLNFITTHPFAYNPSLKFVEKELINRSKLVIGNDVWIGENTIILPNCTRIGDGAVIGAGTIVTKNIPDYAIVVGNPGRVIGYRFSEKEIQLIKESRWWDNEIDEIKKNVHLYQNSNCFFEFLKVRS